MRHTHSTKRAGRVHLAIVQQGKWLGLQGDMVPESLLICHGVKECQWFLQKQCGGMWSATLM